MICFYSFFRIKICVLVYKNTFFMSNNFKNFATRGHDLTRIVIWASVFFGHLGSWAPGHLSVHQSRTTPYKQSISYARLTQDHHNFIQLTVIPLLLNPINHLKNDTIHLFLSIVKTQLIVNSKN